MPTLHHPAVQSLVLPALLAWAGIALLRVLPGGAGARWAPLGAVGGLLTAQALLPGFVWPATASAHKLPWVVLAGLALAAALHARPPPRVRPSAHWLAATLCWVAASAWLAGAQPLQLSTVLTMLAGAAVLALLTWGDRPPAGGRPGTSSVGRTGETAVGDGAAVAAALTVAALGLTALAGRGGSLLLAQLALALATVSAVLGLWVWLRPAAGLSAPAAALLPLGLAGLVTAAVLHQGAAVGAVPLAGLALALAAPPLLGRIGALAFRPRWAPLASAALAALPVALALAWQIGAGGAASTGPGAADDPYYDGARRP